LLLGNSGTGKTHLALALGLAACQRGHRVRFTTAAALVHELTFAIASLVLDLLFFRCELYTTDFVRTISIDQFCEIVGLEWIEASGLLA